MWKIQQRKSVYQAGPCRLDELAVVDPNGKLRTRILLSVGGDSVLIIPRKKDGKYLLCQQDRIGFPAVLEFPNGGIEEGETPKKAAARELKEELGAQGTLEYKGFFVPLVGLVDLKVHVFTCKDATFDRASQNPDEYEKITLVEYSSKELAQLVKKGKIIDGYTLAALHMEGI